jgi:hypothetical protein
MQHLPSDRPAFALQAASHGVANSIVILNQSGVL